MRPIPGVKYVDANKVNDSGSLYSTESERKHDMKLNLQCDPTRLTTAWLQHRTAQGGSRVGCRGVWGWAQASDRLPQLPKQQSRHGRVFRTHSFNILLNARYWQGRVPLWVYLWG